MPPVVDLAGARLGRTQRLNDVPCPGSPLAKPLPLGIQARYQELARGAADTMPEGLRVWLRCWASQRGISEAALWRFAWGHGRGLSATIAAARHDATTAGLLAPEMLVALLALDQDPDALRVDWPRDRRELDALADTFGRPFAG